MTLLENNKRIAKNTLYLYIRMFLIMGVTLYTSRVILQSLGVEDFGIYNIVAGIVVLFSFLNNAMAISSQRFLSFALGEKDDKDVKKIFSMSMTSHIAIALIVFLVAETLGLWMLWEMNIPADRIIAARWTYQFAVFTCIVQIVRVPYNASIIAYEKMSFYAWISIIEVLLKLVIVYLLIAYKGDKLILYSFLLFFIACLINFLYKIYCNKNFQVTKYYFHWDPILLKKILSFSGWSLFGSLANVSASQGINMIINLFCGVVANATVGISNQVASAVSQFLCSVQTAFNPQLVKSYATGDNEYFMNLIFKSSKFSYYLMITLSLPVIINCDIFLNVWLGSAPEYSTEFSQLMIVFLLIDAISGPLWIAVQATGRIKKYQILMAVLILLNLPLSYICLRCGYSPVYVFVIRVAINFITLGSRIYYLKLLIKLPIYRFFKEVINPIILVTFVSIPLSLYIDSFFYGEYIKLICSSICIALIILCIIIVFGLTRSEKKDLYSFVLRKF